MQNLTEMTSLEMASLGSVFVFGVLWGSFFNVCIVRIPLGESVFGGRSRCPKCRKNIPWYLNIPLLSFLFLKGRCAFCRQSISLQYPLVELLSGVFFGGAFLHFGWTLSAAAMALFFSTLLVISVIDLHHRIIPDVLSLGGAVVGFLLSFFVPYVNWWESLCGWLLGGGVFLFIATLYEKWKKQEGLGGGDIKLLGMIGAWLGYKSILLVVLVSSALGSVVGVFVMLFARAGLKTAIPFGPFLALAALFYVFWGSRIEPILFPQLP